MKQRAKGEYTQEFKSGMVRRMLDGGQSASSLSKETGVSTSALCRWRAEAEGAGAKPELARRGENSWSSEDRFHAVVETYSMNAAEIGEYCRAKGLYPEQLQEWRETCLQANTQQAALHQQLRAELRDEKRSKAVIEKELRRKEKALAEAAALLVLRKKAEAIWGVSEEE